MKVILLADVRGTGRKGDRKEVREGYARNFLIPRKLVAVATDDALAAKTRDEQAREMERAERRRKAEVAAKELADLEFAFPVKAGATGEVYGSITVKDIEKAVAARGYRGVTVKLPKPLKTLGAHRVELDLGEGIKTAVGVTVVSES